MTIEECLAEIREKTALLRYVALAATMTTEPPSPVVFAGIADVCGEIEAMARAVSEALGPAAVGIESKQSR